jgi:sugar phosphate isomerase/epimerase
MNELAIEHLCVFGMPPVEFVTLAAELGCECVATGFEPMGGYVAPGYPDWSLRASPGLRQEMRTALRDNGVRISLVEGFKVAPDRDMRDYAADLDLVCELQGDRINALSVDKDLQRAIEGYAVLAEMAAERGLLVSAEMGSLGAIGRVDAALAAMRGVGMANFTLLLDTMHFFRLGNTVEDLARLEPGMIGYIQLCDAPWQARFGTYFEEALYERLPPGEGELPLRDIAGWAPDGVVIGLEVPRRSMAEAGVSPRDRVTPCVAAARSMFRLR